MKGIVLAGGLGTRLYPSTHVINKHTLPVYDRPMFYWSLQTLIDSGLKDIAVVSGPPFGQQIRKLIEFFPKPKRVKLRYIVQPTPGGMPDAIARCKNIFKNNNIIVIAGDNYYNRDFTKEVLNFKKGAVSFLRKVQDPQRYGVPIFKNNKLIRIEEKPKKPKTNLVVTGPHLFDENVFDYIAILKPSARGELEISELNSLYIKNNTLKLIRRIDKWGDTGTYDSLLSVSILAKKYADKK